MNMKRGLRISLYVTGALMALIILLYVFFGTRTSQRDIYVDRTEGRLIDAMLEGEPCFINVAPGLRFRVDTGSDISYITERDLALLDSLGYKIEEKIYPVIGRNTLGDIDYAVKRYTVDFPAYCWTTDSVSVPIEETKNVFHNVDFALSPTDFSVLGIDFLEHFKIEHRTGENHVAFYKDDTPEGYEECQAVKRKGGLLIWPLLGKRYYLNMAVAHTANDFFIDTGMRVAFMKQPYDDADNSIIAYEDTTMSSYINSFPAKVDKNCWIQIGQRQGKSFVYYFDNEEEDYSTNPVNMLNYSMVLDFPNRRLLFRK